MRTTALALKSARALLVPGPKTIRRTLASGSEAPLFQPFACKHVIQHSGRGGSACAEHRLRQQTLWCPTDKHRNWLNFNFSFLLCAMAGHPAQPALPKGSQRPPDPPTPPRKAPVQRPTGQETWLQPWGEPKQQGVPTTTLPARAGAHQATEYRG